MATTETIGGGTLETLSAEEVKALYDANSIILIDVRTPGEYAFEHIAGALLAPMSSFDPARLPSGGDRPIVLHCGSGVRSRRMAEKCIEAGFSRISHMGGGFGAWKQAGYGFLGTDPATGAHVPRP
ncbi:rhodanese-like domain-containing protein [Polymorphum gilvum]|uniref:Rhodanese-related sulfurtransferase, putative n=1 Tax=Polymorphum gilvum (strain LMG 25793 / CGMCC 1.9160 / SL003B-26A1) TaxID=991905 RepID=F2IVE0_POLGS|nr:rhodanese-like domain-containing protein [Polymorphum gilvum]ADZ72658.1 Rhodanese-related sulfurtransferase, putative [Polymorphum gilvum SL003B-26A1]